MLIERVRVTLLSMLWSKDYLESKGTTQQAAAAAEEAQAKLYEEPGVSFSDVFQARIGEPVRADPCDWSIAQNAMQGHW